MCYWLKNIQILDFEKNQPFLFDIMDVINSPIPNPISIDPTNARGDLSKKKNPTPIPIITPPPIAHVLLSSFLFVILFSIKIIWLCPKIWQRVCARLVAIFKHLI